MKICEAKAKLLAMADLYKSVTTADRKNEASLMQVMETSIVLKEADKERADPENSLKELDE